MEKTIIVSGASYEVALASALNQLGLDRDSVSVQVLQQAKAGFLGFGKQPAKIQVTYEAPDPVVAPEKPKSALGSASRSKPKAAAPVKKAEPAVKEEKKPEAPKAEKKAEAPKAEKKAEAPKQPKAEKKVDAPKQPKAEKKVDAPKQPKAEKKAEAPKAPAAPKAYAPAEAGSV
jgi:spoIIIJ-associated protein